MIIDVALKQFCSKRQEEYIDAINETGSICGAARKLNIARQNVQEGIKKIKRKAALKGYSPENDMVHIVPDPFVVKGTSTLYKDGVAKIQWVKTSLDNDKHQQMMLEAIEAMKEDIPRVSLMLPPPLGNDDLCNCYVVTDYHLGMLAWKEESGQDWDIKIAEDLLVKWFAQAILSAATTTPIHSNVKLMNSTPLLGTGIEADKWRGNV